MKNDDTAKILIADDHPLVCVAIKKMLDDCPEFQVVGEAKDGEEAVRLAAELSPDLVIMDISMPGINGLEATRQIKTKCRTTVLILTVHSDIEHIFGILNAGADGYLTKTAHSEEIIQAVRGLIAGDTVLSPDVFQQILKQGMRYPVEKYLGDHIIDRFSVREIEVLSLAAQGLSNKEIALHLNISTPAVKNYFADIFSKLCTCSRTGAVIKALKHGIIKLNGLEKDSI